MPGMDPPAMGGGARAVAVSLNDFPVFDGASSPESFIRQCRRVAALGGIDDAQLSAIMAARCRGLALQVIESSGEQTDVAGLLMSSFAPQQRQETAAMQLSAIKKGALPIMEYALQVRALVRDACPELFDQAGSVKKVCAPAHQAALYRHFLTGLTPDERVLLSRQGAATFDAAVRELTREEAVVQQSIPHSDQTRRSLEVRWADSAPADARGARSPSREPAGTPPGGRRTTSGEWRRRSRPRSVSPERGDWRDRQRSGGAGGPRARAEGGSRRQSDPPRTGGRGRRRSGSPHRWSSDSEDSEMPRASPGPGTGRGPGSPDGGRPQVRCWSCRGYGHLKRQCPNGQPGRRAGGY